jgi:hypothetical protein
MNEEMVQPGRRPNPRLLRLAIILFGIVVGQFLLYGPSLMGRKILLPLDFLAMPSCYLPDTLETPNGYPHDQVSGDLVMQYEPDRIFAVKELRAGRFPLWTPSQYGGVPFIAPKYSPFFLLTCLTPSPRIIPWVQLLAAMVAGTGIYVFVRRVVGVGFWPATLVAWCYPMSGFFVFWQGHWGPAGTYWLGWLLLAVDRTVRGGRVAPVGLAVVTGLVLVSGHLDVAALVLLVSGLFGLWCLWEMNGVRLWSRVAGKAVLGLVLGWGLGFLVAAPNILPVVEYARTGYRMMERLGGKEERPPVGLIALPQVVLPDMYGSSVKGSFPFFADFGESNLPESSAAAYAGVLATLVGAPLAWCSRRQRSLNWFWLGLAVFSLSWCLDLPGFVDFLSLPGLNMLSYNRLVFAASFAILALAATGLEVLRQGECHWGWGLWLPIALLAGLMAWCVYRAGVSPGPLFARLEKNVRAGQQFLWVDSVEDLRPVRAWLSAHYRAAAVWCGAGLIVWLALRFRVLEQWLLMPVLGALLLGDLLWFSHGRNTQSDPALYFPEIPALREMAMATPGRFMGNGCFPPDLAEAVGLDDVRGYDAVDPGRWVSLLKSAAGINSSELDYAATQWLTPQGRITKINTLQLSPILDMLGVRYVVSRGSPPPGVQPAFRSPDYWILENPSVLPRVFVPKRVKVVPRENERLWKLSQLEFNPREVAYVEVPVDLPTGCRGEVEIRNETPTRIVVAARMETSGLVVLADRWDNGWRAFVDGKPVPILVANQAIRGVVLPAGRATLEFRYQSASVRLGFFLAGAAGLILFGWLGMAAWLGGKARRWPGP